MPEPQREELGLAHRPFSIRFSHALKTVVALWLIIGMIGWNHNALSGHDWQLPPNLVGILDFSGLVALTILLVTYVRWHLVSLRRSTRIRVRFARGSFAYHSIHILTGAGLLVFIAYFSVAYYAGHRALSAGAVGP